MRYRTLPVVKTIVRFCNANVNAYQTGDNVSELNDEELNIVGKRIVTCQAALTIDSKFIYLAAVEP